MGRVKEDVSSTVLKYVRHNNDGFLSELRALLPISSRGTSLDIHLGNPSYPREFGNT